MIRVVARSGSMFRRYREWRDVRSRLRRSPVSIDTTVAAISTGAGGTNTHSLPDVPVVSDIPAVTIIEAVTGIALRRGGPVNRDF
jgi:transketolase C-terminal domain/subunit